MAGQKNSFLAVVVPETDSTMTEARKLAPSLKDFGADKVFAVYAEKQLAGKGRNGSKWIQAEEELLAKSTAKPSSLDSIENSVKPFAEALEDKPDFLPLTFIVSSPLIKIQYSWLGIATGCAVYDALQKTASHMRSTCLGLPYPKYSPEPFYVKWPNDILYKRYDNTWRKLCGILCETSFQGNQAELFYIGIGLNLFSAPDIPEAGSFLDWILSSVQEKPIAKKEINKWLKNKENKNEIMQVFSEALESELHQYLFTPRLSQQLKGLALERSFPIGTILKVNKGTRIGGFNGFSQEGGLLLEGSDEVIYAGGVELFSEEHTNGITQNTHPQATLPREEAAHHNPISRNQGASFRKEENKKETPQGTLALDCGNTRVHWSYKNHEGQVVFGHFSNEELTPDSLESKPTLLRPLFRAMVQERQGKVKLLCASVRQENAQEEVSERLKTYIKKSFPEVKIESVNVKINELLLIANLQGEYGDTLGLDRALRFIFAAQKATKKRKNIATCSAGTALTFECVSKKGHILESFIMPGLQMSLDAMAAFTEMLPKLRWNVEQIRMTGGPFTTENAMQTGTLLSALGALIVSLKTTQVSDL